MSRTYGAHQYTYQILTAVVYTLESKIEELSIEGPNFEDSCFKKDQAITIGEAKYITSKKNWTPRSLFYEGTKIGPLLQLWNRWTGEENLILFSPIPSSNNESLISRPTIPEEIKPNLLEHVRTTFPKIRDIDSFLDGGADLILKNTRFIQMSLDTLIPLIIEWSDHLGVKSNKNQVSRLLTHFSSDTYEPGNWISLEGILTILAEDKNTPILVKDRLTYTDLLNNRLADKVYFSLIWPKSIQDCSLMVFGDDGPSHEKEIEDTISKLCQNNFVQEIESGDEIIFKSEYLPLYEYCRNNILQRSKVSHKVDYDILSNHDRLIFERIFNSNWFSNLLEEGILRFGVRINRREGLVIHESLKFLANFLEVLSQITECFTIRKIGVNIPNTEDFDLEISFDSFCDNWIKENLSESWMDPFIERVFTGAGKYLGVNKYPAERRFLESIRKTKHFLCFPKEFASRMRGCHRVQSTIAVAFCKDR